MEDMRWQQQSVKTLDGFSKLQTEQRELQKFLIIIAKENNMPGHYGKKKGMKKTMNGALKGKQKTLPTALKKKIIASKKKKKMGRA